MAITTIMWTSVVAMATFLVIDLLWLGVIAQNIYQSFMGGIMLEKPRWPAAIAFYTIFVAELMYFAIVPAMQKDSLQLALVNGALYGLFTYATFDLTSYAVLKGFPGGIVPIDMAWGTFLAASVSSITYFVHRSFS